MADEGNGRHGDEGQHGDQHPGLVDGADKRGAFDEMVEHGLGFGIERSRAAVKEALQRNADLSNRLEP